LGQPVSALPALRVTDECQPVQICATFKIYPKLILLPIRGGRKAFQVQFHQLPQPFNWNWLTKPKRIFCIDIDREGNIALISQLSFATAVQAYLLGTLFIEPQLAHTH
jgi:hypothetical protein